MMPYLPISIVVDVIVLLFYPLISMLAMFVNMAVIY